MWFERRFIPSERKVHKNCSSCGVDFWLPPSKAPKYHTCGGDCAFHEIKLAVQSRERACLTCQKLFIPRRYQVEHAGGNYCSQSCNVASQAAMNAPEAQARARASWAARQAECRFVRSGEASPKWKGGRKETYKRRLASGAIREMNHRRRTLTRDKLPPNTVQEIGISQRWRCVYCDASLRKAYHLDHIFPLALGGKHERSNVQLLCVPCNRKKGKKRPEVYAQQVGKLL